MAKQKLAEQIVEAIEITADVSSKHIGTLIRCIHDRWPVENTKEPLWAFFKDKENITEYIEQGKDVFNFDPSASLNREQQWNEYYCHTFILKEICAGNLYTLNQIDATNSFVKVDDIDVWLDIKRFIPILTSKKK